MFIVEILKKRNALFLGAIATGLVIGPVIAEISWLNIPALIAVMTVAALELKVGYFRKASVIIKGAFSGVVLNLFAAGAVVLGLGCLLFSPGPMRDGLILAAVCPPGLAIVPFSIVMGGNVAYSVNAFSTGYLFSVFLTPLLAGLLIGRSAVSVGDVAGVMGQVILIPLVLAFLLKKTGRDKKIRNCSGPVVNAGFALMFAILFGVNRDIFLYEPAKILKLFLIFLVSVPGLALLLRAVLIRVGASRPEGISILLSGTLKNSLFASAIGLKLIGPQAALPGTVLTFVIIGYLMLVERLARVFPR